MYFENMILFILCLFLFGAQGEVNFTLPGNCPNVTLQLNLDYTKFSGDWFNAASFASDNRSIYDCATLNFEEDNLGFTLNETYVEGDQNNRTQRFHQARVDPAFDAGNRAQFIISYEDGDKVSLYPFAILTTDYDNYAIGYTCNMSRKQERFHYVFVWVLSRVKAKLQGEDLKRVEDALSKFSELSEHRKSFIFKDFTETDCAYSSRLDTESFGRNFW